ncbi:NAD(P)/FAD-dependent oxidoreductase [Leifsonia sp. Root112D2]|uniref:NAD(P)/FAD-dependent oxidoreductase n=1 Tax=Leifsonia sp. Root112D2 TaxID=1736426 RepID=UPI0009E8E9B0|nr:FAD-dependent oxidoreductase [Leifsonia sp. Root112D2]
MMGEHFDYVIVGGGMVADAAAHGIREHDAEGTIGILSEDVDPPYTRPALTKKLWTDPDFTWDKVPLGTAEQTGAEVRLQTRVTAIDRDARTVLTDAGETVGYGRLLLATGGHPKHIDLPDDDRVIFFRSANDYRRLRELASRHPHVAVIGGSFIGTELAAALVQNECEVSLLYPEETLGGSMFPSGLAARFEDAFASAGVHLRAGVTVDEGHVENDAIVLHCSDGSALTVDAVVSGLGIEPAIDLAEAAGLQTDDGIVVDGRLQTADPSVYAAGDVASYPDVILGRRRIEHVDNATAMGHAAGRAMAGESQPYTHTPYFYSVVFDISYEALGSIDAELETVEDWVDPLNVGVVYYLNKGVVAGVLLWNVPERRDAARRVLASARSLTRDNLPGLITPG